MSSHGNINGRTVMIQDNDGWYVMGICPKPHDTEKPYIQCYIPIALILWWLCVCPIIEPGLILSYHMSYKCAEHSIYLYFLFGGFAHSWREMELNAMTRLTTSCSDILYDLCFHFGITPIADETYCKQWRIFYRYWREKWFRITLKKIGKQKVWQSILTYGPKIIGGTYTKSGTHLYDKNTRKIYGWFIGCCRGIVTGCEQTSGKTTSTASKVKYVEWCLPVRLHLPEPLFDYATPM